MFWGKEGETSVLFPGMKAGNVYVSADGSLKMKGLVVENSGNSIVYSQFLTLKLQEQQKIQQYHVQLQKEHQGYDFPIFYFEST